MMQKLFLVSLVVILSFSCKSDKKEFVPFNYETSNENTVYYFIRHAEKDRSDSTNKDPELTKKGLERANNWAKTFAEVNFDLIYSTDYKRTIETALPIAKKEKLIIQSYNPKNLNDPIFKGKTKGKIVLIVGHSNTTPAFVNTIIGEKKYDEIDDTDNGKLFIVTIVNDSLSVKIENYN